MKIRLAARGSVLSLVQVEAVARMLAPFAETEITTYRTTGDRLSQLDAAIVGKGVFTKEIDEALLEGRADLGVHSLKDLPSELPAGLALAAVPLREDPSDILISRPRVAFAHLPAGARVGTGSPRRKAQLLAARPDLSVTDARGNVDTRIRRLDAGRWDAIVLARAGLARLGRLEEVCDVFSDGVMLPAIGQGALALVARSDDVATAALLARLDHPESHREVLAERALLRSLEGGCRAPMAGRATASNGSLRLAAAVFSADGAACLREEDESATGDPEELGERLARRLLERGAARLLEEARR
ncbi:MAG: hydroxymethylbilane synthase [Acidobacteriota bacterium]|nr:hydroxymethylbilane synthase [Acidobacteriota bacterium]